MKKIYLLFLVMVFGLNLALAQTDWVDYKIDNRVSVKMPAEPTRINENNVMAATKDSTFCIVALVDFKKTANLDSAGIAPLLPTKEFSDGIKTGMLRTMPGFTLSDVTVGKLKSYYTYTLEGGKPAEKLKCYTYMIVIGQYMYSLSALLSDKKPLTEKDRFFSSLTIH